MSKAVLLLTGLLAACQQAPPCTLPADALSRVRDDLPWLVHISQCPSVTPAPLLPQERLIERHKLALISQIGVSALRADLRRVQEEQAEARDFTFESDCVGTRDEGAEAVERHTLSLRKEQARVTRLQRDVNALLVACPGRQTGPG